jgi:hypothetical protein
VAAPAYYSVRRLSPFLGALQIVSLTEARAYSGDGTQWKVELLSREAVRLPPWGNLGPAAAERRFFTYGYWDAGAGLEPVPVNAILGDQSGHPALGPLLAALETMPAPPFAPADLTELWLLDEAARPLALLRSQPGEQLPPIPRMELSWRAQSPREPPFPRPEPRSGEQPADHEDACLALEGRVHARAGDRRRRAQWFRRAGDGAGRGLAPYCFSRRGVPSYGQNCFERWNRRPHVGQNFVYS